MYTEEEKDYRIKTARKKSTKYTEREQERENANMGEDIRM